MITFEFVLLLAILGFDLYLIKSKRHTLSYRIHKWFPYKVDLGISVGLAGLYWWQLGEFTGMMFILGVIVGHLFWGEGN